MCRESNREPEFYGRLDEKWMFTRSLFVDAAERNLCRLSIFSTTSSFTVAIAELLWHGLGDKDPLPEWARDIVADTDQAIGTALREELLSTGGIAFARV